MLNFGIVRPGRTLYVPFESFASSTGAPITISGFAIGDIKVFKDGGATARASTNGFTLLDSDGIDFSSITGVHGFSIDLSDNSTADFYQAGSQYWIVISTITVDSQTMSFIAATFRIGYHDALLDTFIATLSSQTSFTLNSGPAEDDALNGMEVIIHDASSAVQLSRAIILDYTGASKTVTLAAAPTFTIAAKDNISIMAPSPLQPATMGRSLVVDSAGLADANAVKVGPTGAGVAQTAGDLYTAVSNIAVTGAALNTTAGSRTITTGTGSGGVSNTTGNDGSYDNVADSAGTIDFYYQFDISGTSGAVGVGVQWIGYVVGVANSVNVYAFNWGTSSWDQVGTIVGIAGTTDMTDEWELTTAHTGTGGNLGLVRIRFQNTGLVSATVKTDRVLLGYAVVATFPTNFASLSINASGHIILQDASLVTAKLGTFALAKTTNITGFNDLSAAQVNTEADTALSDINLDHLLAVAAVAGDVVNSSVIARLASKAATPAFTSYDNTNDSLEALRDNLATASALATVQSDTDDIQSRIPAALDGGFMKSKLVDGVTHGGTSAMLRLGSSSSTPALHVTSSSTGAAVKFDGAASYGLVLDGGIAALDIEPTAVNAVGIKIITDGNAIFAQSGSVHAIEAIALNAGWKGFNATLSTETLSSFFDVSAGSYSTAVSGSVVKEIADNASGGTGSGLTAIPWNSAWDAEVQSEVQDAIEVNHLDHLLAVDYDPASKPGVATALLNELIGSDGGVSQFTANALELAPSGGGGGGTAGAGSQTVDITIKDTSGNPIDGVSVWITTDSAGTNVIAGTHVSNNMGIVPSFFLNPGVYYRWAKLGGRNFQNPQQFTVV